MPKVYLSKEERETNRFNDFIRGELRRQGYRFEDLANELNLPTPSVTNRINRKSRWSLEEIIATLAFLGKSYEFGEER